MPLLPHAGPLLTLAIVLVVGVVFGKLAKLARLPRITGQIIAGVLLGEAVLHLFDHGSIVGLQPVTHFALGLMAVTVGAHLNIKRLRIRYAGDDKITCRIRKNGKGPVTGADVECEGDAEVVNKDLVIATLTLDRDFQVELDVTAHHVLDRELAQNRGCECPG